MHCLCQAVHCLADASFQATQCYALAAAHLSALATICQRRSVRSPTELRQRSPVLICACAVHRHSSPTLGVPAPIIAKAVQCASLPLLPIASPCLRNSPRFHASALTLRSSLCLRCAIPNSAVPTRFFMMLRMTLLCPCGAHHCLSRRSARALGCASRRARAPLVGRCRSGAQG